MDDVEKPDLARFDWKLFSVSKTEISAWLLGSKLGMWTVVWWVFSTSLSEPSRRLY
jgi:hypothetical protein